MCCASPPETVNTPEVSVWKPQEWVFIICGPQTWTLCLSHWPAHVFFPEPYVPHQPVTSCHLWPARESPDEASSAFRADHHTHTTQTFQNAALRTRRMRCIQMEDLKDPSVSALHEPDYWVRISIKGHRAQFNDCYALNSLLVVSPGKPCALYTTLRTISQLFPSTAISFSCVCL